jgi:hypothetical protein
VLSTYLIRDFSTVAGGGFAEVHANWCERITQRPIIEGVWVVDERFHRTTADLAEHTFRARFTVPFDVRHCQCAVAQTERHAAELRRRVAACDDD